MGSAADPQPLEGGEQDRSVVEECLLEDTVGIVLGLYGGEEKNENDQSLSSDP